MSTIVGIDGCRTGWLCLTKDLDTGIATSQILQSIDLLLEFDPAPLCIAVDIPIGLPDAGHRNCDREARRLLGWPRQSSVFSAPIRSMLQAADYEEACQLGRNRDGRALSRQAWGIVPKIREMDALLTNHPAMVDSVFEVHPELSFWLWNDKSAMVHGKKTLDGRRERESLVDQLYERDYVAARKHLKKGAYANDDLLDAFAALWTADRIQRGISIRLPDATDVDSLGIPKRIVA
jgi:predicted RNase H-like nuclease